jgi:hypothetical protein
MPTAKVYCAFSKRKSVTSGSFSMTKFIGAAVELFLGSIFYELGNPS